MLYVRFGEGRAGPQTEKWPWSEAAKLLDGSVHPEAVELDIAELSDNGTTAEKIVNHCRAHGISISAVSPPQSHYEKVVATLLGIADGGEPIPQPLPSARKEDVFVSGAQVLLAQSFRYLDAPASLLEHLWTVLKSYATLEVMVVSLSVGSRLEMFVCPPLPSSDWEDLLKFCKQDVLAKDRFIDTDHVDVHFSSAREALAAYWEGPIRSYSSFPLTDESGHVFALLHLGSVRNHYFNETVLHRLQEVLGIVGTVVAQTFRYRDLSIRKDGLLALFAKFLPEPVIQRLLKERRPSQKGRKASVVVLFSDIRSFTSITETNGAEPVVQFLNRHFEAMVAPITEQGGVIDKFIGDAIVAVFDADKDPADTCARAVRAARKMLEELPHVDVSAVHLDQGRYGIGIGLHWGEVVAGYVGSPEKMAYTVIGEVIEHAEELESETKKFGVGMLMSASFAQQVTASDLVLRDLSKHEKADPLHPVFTLETRS